MTTKKNSGGILRTDRRMIVIVEKCKIQGIPAYVVNGKYLIMIKSIRSLDAMFETIKELKALP